MPFQGIARLVNCLFSYIYACSSVSLPTCKRSPTGITLERAIAKVRSHVPCQILPSRVWLSTYNTLPVCLFHDHNVMAGCGFQYFWNNSTFYCRALPTPNIGQTEKRIVVSRKGLLGRRRSECGVIGMWTSERADCWHQMVSKGCSRHKLLDIRDKPDDAWLRYSGCSSRFSARIHNSILEKASELMLMPWAVPVSWTTKRDKLLL